MLRIILQNGTGEFNQLEKFAAELYLNNIMLTDAGEQTIPITLPPTPNNLKLVQWGHRLDNFYKPLSFLNVNISEGVFFKKCRMQIWSISKKEGITCTLYLNNGGFNAKVTDIKMSQLDWLIQTTGNQIPPFNYQSNNIYRQMQIFIKNNPDKFVLSPVMTSKKVRNYYLSNNKPVWYDSFVYFNMYNRRLSYGGDSTFPNSVAPFVPLPPSYILNSLQWLEAEKNYGALGDSDVWWYYGFAAAPFLKIRYLLETLFSFFDYNFSYNDFTTYESYFENIILIHNVADAALGTTLNIADLVTDLPIKDFLKEIETIFAGRFIYNDFKKTVKFLFFNDVFSKDVDMDLSQYLVSELKISPIEKVKLVLRDTNEDSAEDETDTDKDVKLEIIEFKHLKYAKIQTKMVFQEDHIVNPNDTYPNNLNVYDIQLDLLNMNEEPIRKKLNLKFTVNGGIKDIVPEFNNEENTKVRLGSFDNTEQIGQKVVVTNQNETLTDWFKYKTTKKVFHGLANTNLDYENQLYEHYKSFIENSNIKIECQMKIPLAILNNINLQKPKLLQGQRVIIESIKTIFGKTDEFQEVVLRTIRPYAERDS